MTFRHFIFVIYEEAQFVIFRIAKKVSLPGERFSRLELSSKHCYVQMLRCIW